MIYGHRGCWRCYDIWAISPPSTWKLKCKFIASDLSWSQENSGVQRSSLHNAKLGSRLGEVWFIASPLAKILAVTGFNWDWFQFRFPQECVYPICNDCCAVFILYSLRTLTVDELRFLRRGTVNYRAKELCFSGVEIFRWALNVTNYNHC